MGLRIQVFLLFLCYKFFITAAVTNYEDAAALKSLKDVWEGLPPNWVGADPCGDRWEGIDCTNSRVTSMIYPTTKNSKDLFHQTIRNLKNLTKLLLLGCSFSGPIPDSVGSLKQLEFLFLSFNSFSGQIPPSVGKLSKLLWLDLTENQIEGPIPVSDGVSPGLDMLLNAQHFHLGKNQLSGHIPEKLFSSNMQLVHTIFDSNQLTGTLPSSLGLVKTLVVVAMNNNSFDASTLPSWFSTSQSLERIVMDRTALKGEVPREIFNLPNLHTVVLNHNNLSGTLNIGPSSSNLLRSINLQSNFLTAFVDRPEASKDIAITLADNPICQESGETKSYCTVSEQSSFYTTQAKNCVLTSCSSNQISSPTCKCAHPYRGTIKFIAPSFSGVGNKTYYGILEQSLLETYQSFQLPVDSISLSNPRRNPSQYLEIKLAVFPSGQDSFNRTGVAKIAFIFTRPAFKPPSEFGPYYFYGEQYLNFAG